MNWPAPFPQRWQEAPQGRPLLRRSLMRRPKLLRKELRPGLLTSAVIYPMLLPPAFWQRLLCCPEPAPQLENPSAQRTAAGWLSGPLAQLIDRIVQDGGNLSQGGFGM